MKVIQAGNQRRKAICVLYNPMLQTYQHVTTEFTVTDTFLQ